MHCVISTRSGICPAPATLRNKHGRTPGDGSYGYGCRDGTPWYNYTDPEDTILEDGPCDDLPPADPLDPTDDLPEVGDAGSQPDAEANPRQRRPRASSWRLVLMLERDSE